MLDVKFPNHAAQGFSEDPTAVTGMQFPWQAPVPLQVLQGGLGYCGSPAKARRGTGACFLLLPASHRKSHLCTGLQSPGSGLSPGFREVW